MPSSKSYKLWFRRFTDADWTEALHYIDFAFRDIVNSIPSLDGVTVYARDATLRAILSTSATYYRITKHDSTNGNNGTLIQTGIVSESTADAQTARPGELPIVYYVTGRGFADRVVQFNYDAETTFNATRASIVNSLIAQVNAQAGSTVVVAGTLDTGPTLNVRVRKDKLHDYLLRLASVGDATNRFTAIVEVDHDASFRPRIHVRDPNNALYRTSDPFAAADGRVITTSDCRPPVRVVPERDRIRNAVKIRYGGFGSGSPQTDLGFVSDATSIATHGRREAVLQAPWIQNGATAQLYADTLIGMFKGSSKGIERAEIVMRWGEYQNASFNARLGDVVGVRLPDGTQAIQGRLLAYIYKQMEESITFFIGYPRVPFQEAKAEQSNARSNLTTMQTSQTQTGSVRAQLLDAVLGSVTISPDRVVPTADEDLGSIPFDPYESLAIEAQLVYADVGGEPDPGLWHVHVGLRRQDGAWVEFLRQPLYITKGMVWQVRTPVLIAYLQGIGFTSVTGVRIHVFNTHATDDQTINGANATLDGVTRHVHPI